jgi:Rrf2 family protein
VHLSAQEEYGLRCLVQLARHEGEEPMRIQDIARAEGLSSEYVAKLMRILRNGALVTSTRGASGGYRLAQAPSEVTLWDAIAVLGGPLFPDSFCEAHPGALRDCVHSPNCSIRGVWRSLSSLLRAALGGITIADLARGDQSAAARLGQDWKLAHERTTATPESQKGQGPTRE